MIISVGSGKGGTGKTTVSTNLALSIDDIQFFDFDVEENGGQDHRRGDIGGYHRGGAVSFPGFRENPAGQDRSGHLHDRFGADRRQRRRGRM